MKILYLLVFLIIISCNRTSVYTKFSYSYPSLNIAPFEAISTADIWFQRIKHRGLTKFIKGGLVQLDLAKSINFSGKILSIDLHKNQKDSRGNLINSHYIKKSIEHFRKKSDHQLSKLITNIKILSDYQLNIFLNKSYPLIKQALASHLFLIHNPIDLSSSTGLYSYNEEKKLFTLNNKNLKEYPDVIKILQAQHSNEIDFNLSDYDTSLIPP